MEETLLPEVDKRTIGRFLYYDTVNVGLYVCVVVLSVDYLLFFVVIAAYLVKCVFSLFIVEGPVSSYPCDSDISLDHIMYKTDLFLCSMAVLLCADDVVFNQYVEAGAMRLAFAFDAYR